MPLRLPVSSKPGRHERHFLRKLNNPLFPNPLFDYSDDELLDAQRLDHEELLAYLGDLRELVLRAASLKPNEESQHLLDLKGELEERYLQACTLADDQSDNKAVINQLLAAIMRTLRAVAAGDTLATQELDDEELARAQHLRLLEEPLVADLLDANNLIAADELVPVLLSATPTAFAAALELFDQEQRIFLADQVESLLARFDRPEAQWRERLIQLRT